MSSEFDKNGVVNILHYCLDIAGAREEDVVQVEVGITWLFEKTRVRETANTMAMLLRNWPAFVGCIATPIPKLEEEIGYETLGFVLGPHEEDALGMQLCAYFKLLKWCEIKQGPIRKAAGFNSQKHLES